MEGDQHTCEIEETKTQEDEGTLDHEGILKINAIRKTPYCPSSGRMKMKHMQDLSLI